METSRDIRLSQTLITSLPELKVNSRIYGNVVDLQLRPQTIDFSVEVGQNGCGAFMLIMLSLLINSLSFFLHSLLKTKSVLANEHNR